LVWNCYPTFYRIQRTFNFIVGNLTKHKLPLRRIVASTQAIVSCPVCNCVAQKIHSHYERRLTDLPWANYKIILQLRVRKFFCTNQTCPRRIFTERLFEVTVPWGRRTQRLTERLAAVGIGLGGAAGERLSQHLGIRVSRNTLLRLISKLPLPQVVSPQTLGVDDFAFRKRQNYCRVSN